MSEEQIVNEVVEEVIETTEAEQQTEDVTEAEAAIETKIEEPSFNMDFSDLSIPEVSEQPKEPDYDVVIENIVNKVLEQSKVKSIEDKSEDDEDDMTYMTKKELAEYESKIEQKILAKLEEQQKAQQLVQKAVQGSLQVKQTYVDKIKKTLSSNGLSLDDNPQLQSAANMLFANLELSYAAQKGRLATDPATGQPMAILTADETKALARQHWDIFSKTYLPGFKANPQKTVTNPLSAAGSGMKADPGVDNNSDFSKFMEKKAQGKETLSDALNLLLKSGGKK